LQAARLNDAALCARRSCGPPLTPETTAAPGSRKSGQATACPAPDADTSRPARSPQPKSPRFQGNPGLTVRAVYEGHVQYVPEWRPILTFAQVTAFSPGVCKTVGYAFPGSNPGLATTSGNGPWPGYSRARVTMWVG